MMNTNLEDPEWLALKNYWLSAMHYAATVIFTEERLTILDPARHRNMQQTLLKFLQLTLHYNQRAIIDTMNKSYPKQGIEMPKDNKRKRFAAELRNDFEKMAPNSPFKKLTDQLKNK